MESWIIYYIKSDGSILKKIYHGDLYGITNIYLPDALGGSNKAIVKIKKITSPL